MEISGWRVKLSAQSYTNR